MKHGRVIFLLAIIIFISGCTGLADVFGKDIVKIMKETKEEGFKDILVIKDIKTIPTSPVLPVQQIMLTFVVENRDKEKTARDVRTDIFDPSAFTVLEDPKQCSKKENTPCIILPGEQKQITFKLRAPSTTQIAGLKTPLKISFRVEYVFAGSTLQDVIVVTEDEIVARMRAGQTLSLKKSDIRGSGPVQIEVAIKGAEFVLPGQDATFEFIIKSKGDELQGTVQESRIGPGGFSITFPRNMFRDEKEAAAKGEKTLLFSPGDEVGLVVDSGNDLNCNCINPQDGTPSTGQCGTDKNGNQRYLLIAGFKEKSGPITSTNPCITDEAENKGNCPNGIVENEVCLSTDERIERLALTFYCSPEGVCWNKKPIDLFKGDSIPLLFRISGVRNIVEPYRTFQIRSDIQYTYELRNSIDVTVNPFTNV